MCAANPNVIHYLDDFLFFGPPGSDLCRRTLNQAVSLCGYVGFPLVPEKLEGPTKVLTFLGVEIDTEKFTLSVPKDKLEVLLPMLTDWKIKKTCTRRELESLLGSLGFVSDCIPSGRSFLRRMRNTACRVKRMHHVIRLSADFHRDLDWWLEFLPQWNGTAEFLEVDWSSPATLQLFTDASGTEGFGGYFDGQWFQGRWPDWLLALKPPITFLETYPIYIACALWGSKWRTRRVEFYCDNSGTVQIWHRGSSKNVAIMEVVRRTLFIAAQGNFAVKITHVPGADNGIADALSRYQADRFRQLAPTARNCGEPVPDLLTRLRPLLEAHKNWANWEELPVSSLQPEWHLLPEELMTEHCDDLRSSAPS